jgi:RNA polymerase sigma factor (sigma-70 family)
MYLLNSPCAGELESSTGRGSHVSRSQAEPESVSERPNTLDCDALYSDFQPLVRRLLRQYGATRELQEDLSGEIYCRFRALLLAYEPERRVPLRPYLVRQLPAAVYTYARQQWRRQCREVSLEARAEHEPDMLPSNDPTPDWDHSLVLQGVRNSLPEAIQSLPKRQRNVVIWRYYEERSYEEIASLLGVQVSTARSLLRHGLNRLRRQVMVSPSEIG